MKKMLRMLASALFLPGFVFSQNVGIGTTSPEYKLHVLNASGESGVGVNATGTATLALVNISIDNRIDGNALALIKYRSGVAGNTAGIPKSNLSVVAADAGAGALLLSTNQASPMHFATNFVERMRILADGSVGIGTATPAVKLHVFADGGPARLRVETNTASQDAALELKTNGGVFDFLEMKKWMPGSGGTIAGISLAGLSQVTTGASTTGGLMVGTKTAFPLYFTTDNTQRMRITADGKIGVNTAATTSLLDVEGRSDVPITGYFNDVITTGPARLALGAYINTSVSNSAAIGASTYEGGGVAGVDPVTYAVVGTSGNGGYAIAGFSLASTALRGKSASGKALHTSGQIKMDGIGEAANRVLTSDATGNATWQALPGSASVWAINGNNINNTNTGNVGVGTISPNYKLHVSGGDLFVQSSAGKIILGYDGGNQWRWGTTNAGADMYMISFNGTTETHYHYFAQNGNVGINTGIGTPQHAQLRVERGSGAGISTGGEIGTILGINQNTAAGSGVTGITTAPRTGAASYAGVTGFNLSNATDRFGVIGSSSGTTSGSIYSAGVGGYGDYGVLGYSQSSKGAGVIAQHGLGLTALEVNNGFIKSTGTAGNKTAFVHTASLANLVPLYNYATQLTYANPLQTDIVIVTHNYNPAGATSQYLNSPISVWWTGAGWAIFNENLSDMVVSGIGKSFNVLVIKQ